MTKNTKYEEIPLMRLTEDLLHEILFRLPTKTLGKCKLVSKEWNSLISDPNFAISHHDHSTKTKLPLTLASQKENYFSVLQFEDYLDITQGVYLALLHEQIPASDYEDYYCFLIGSCHGLVCLYLMCKKTSYGYMEDLMLIWNPVTNECEQIPLPNERGKSKIFLREDSCWFGYLGSIDDYKIVLVYFLGKPVFEDCMFVYSFRTSEWKKVCHRAEWDMPFEEGCNSVFMDEALYYLSWYDWICKFDLVAETFERFPFLINEPELIDKSRQILMGFIREENSLCVMFVQHPAEQEQGYAVEIWILQEYNKWDSWKKVYNLRFQPGTVRNSIKAFRFLHNGIVCIQTGNGLGLFDPNADPLPYAIVRDPSCAKVYKVTDYVESLISPFDLP